MSFGLLAFLNELFYIIFFIVSSIILFFWGLMYELLILKILFFTLSIILFTVILILFYLQLETHFILAHLKFSKLINITINGVEVGSKKIVELFNKKRWASAEYENHPNYKKGSTMVISMANKNKSQQIKFIILYNDVDKKIVLNYIFISNYYVFIPNFYETLKELNIDFTKSKHQSNKEELNKIYIEMKKKVDKEI